MIPRDFAADPGLRWMVVNPGTGGLSDEHWVEAVGSAPNRGSAGGFVSDMYLEFGWCGVIVCYLIGRVYAAFWIRSWERAGVWTIIYIELLVLSVYLPSQSAQAWLYRGLLLVVPTCLLWRYVVSRIHSYELSWEQQEMGVAERQGQQ